MNETYRPCRQCGTKYLSSLSACPKCQAKAGAQPQKTHSLACPLCKSGPMQAKFLHLIQDQVARFFGIVIAAATVITLGLGLYEATQNLTWGILTILGSSIEGAVGFLIIAQRPVWMCPKCNHYLPRAAR